MDKIQYDVLPLKVCHNLFGRVWLYGKKAQHCGYNNTYSFKYRKTEIKMVPIKKLSALSLKAQEDSWVVFAQVCILGDSILGPPPNSTELRSFKRGGIDAAALYWMDKRYLIWKPKPKYKQPRS